MNDEQEEKEVQEPKQITTKDSVRILLKAFELAGIAGGYKINQMVSARSTKIFVNNGNQAKEDPTLAHYIEIAERKYVAENSPLILEDARFMLEKEIEEIRRLVNG